MRRKAALAARLVLVVLAICGCIVQKKLHTVNGQTFSSGQETPGRHALLVEQSLSGIQPTTRQLAARALVAIPTFEHFKEYSINEATGNHTLLVSPDWIDYMARTYENVYKGMFRALQRRRIFHEVNLVQCSPSEWAPFSGYDYLIYLYTPSPDSHQWYITKESWVSPQPILIDMGQPEGTERTVSWLDCIETYTSRDKSASPALVPTLGVTRRTTEPDQPDVGEYWAVIVGVSKYSDSRIPAIRYPSNDANAFYEWATSPEGGKYAPSRVKLLLDGNASCQNIRNALFTWLKQPLAEDVITIYFAGHGSPESPDAPDNLFLLPHDARYDDIASTAFPMWDIETALKRYIKARKVIVIADACHSGGVGQSFDIARRANRGLKVNPISTSIQNLSEVGDGVCVISASDDKQLSRESEDWGGGHGVFTYFLLKGLRGGADYNHDSFVTLGELTSYLSQEVRRATKNTQSPTVAGRYDPALTIGK